MSKEYYVFKLNLEPKILHAYDYENYKENVISEVIPGALKEIFSHNSNIDDSKIKFSDTIDINEVKSSNEYLEMLHITNKMIEMYHAVVGNYNSGKGITYSPEYLENRDNLNAAIKRLISIYPFLKGAFDLREDVFPVHAFSKIKMSIAYIKKALQIKYYLDHFPKSEADSEFIYDKSNEYIYISKENKTVNNAKSYVQLLVEKINSFSSSSNIGRITINPIYLKFDLEGMYSEITFEISYPNGNPARDRSNALEQANAARETSKLEASKDDKIDSSKLVKRFKDYAESGYVIQVTSRGKDIIKSIIKTTIF